MKLIAPDYYTEFQCIAGDCKNTCCRGWEIDIDPASLSRMLADPAIAPHVSGEDTPHFTLLEDESCPFLRPDGLCDMILRRGEDFLCDICRDHPRFRSFWSDRTELGLGLVCEEAARLILGRETPMRLVTLSDDGKIEPLPEDEAWLLSVREGLLAGITETGPRARLLEYLIYRYVPDALYDDRLDERLRFIERSFRELTALFDATDGSLSAICDCARQWSYDVEYDDDELERRISDDET